MRLNNKVRIKILIFAARKDSVPSKIVVCVEADRLPTNNFQLPTILPVIKLYQQRMSILTFQKPDKIVMQKSNDFEGEFEFKRCTLVQIPGFCPTIIFQSFLGRFWCPIRLNRVFLGREIDYRVTIKKIP